MNLLGKWTLKKLSQPRLQKAGFLLYNNSMKNIHLPHPEDSILTGDLTVLDAFLMEVKLSVKYDGSPAIVWGKNPTTGNQFVGTKSVFNKFKIKINESHEDIDRNHQGNVAEILHACFDYLPDSDRILQGDFIGFGGETDYTPNTVTYSFVSEMDHEIIIAPHTEYTIDPDEVDLSISPNPFWFAEAKPLRGRLKQPLQSDEILEGTDCCYFVQPSAGIWTGIWGDYSEQFELGDLCKFARIMATLVEFEDEKGARQLEKDLNAYIRDGDEIVAEEFANYQLVRLWMMVKEIKEQALAQCRPRHAGCMAFIGQDSIDAEGYVMHGIQGGSWKLVDRELFSHANFNNAKWCATS